MSRFKEQWDEHNVLLKWVKVSLICTYLIYLKLFYFN